ncbi:MAG: hypothetical protein ONB16_06675 [candidate division KSB1 bacterium]|nr:hypothetical protein [candidate division KSB1 bacterium]MDZ7319858.1 hypothetical protein [candidate division KSB1 bacterium]MDZ7340545.1 hypothetical protein [candidate division KSB1 bacterium]
MEQLIKAFAPAFAAALGLQQLLEILDPIFSWLKDKKGMVLKPLSLLAGLVFSIFAGMRVLAHLNYTGAELWDIIVTSLIISGGTEGFNSILKFLGYTKEKKSVEVQKERELSGHEK